MIQHGRLRDMRPTNSSFRFMAQALTCALLAAPAFAQNANYTYLALGESISFGYDPTVAQPWSPNKFTGYPEVVAEILRESNKEVNASCPGETSGSFITFGAPDNGCQGFKNAFGLHTNYAGSQLNFAVSQLQTDRHINLVTLSIGGNDLLLLEQQCATAPSFAVCVNAKLPAVLTTYAQNLAYILTSLRAQGNYNGKLILMNLYSPSADPLFLQVVGALDQVMVEVGTPFGAKFADGYGAFRLASALFQNDPCKAGLLIRLGPASCDVHPSPAGRDLLAATVLIALFGR
jgi:lysophospholipase L1-like esterase